MIASIVTIVLLLLCCASASFLQQSNPPRVAPICSANETCRSYWLNVQLSFCRCPGQTKCPQEHVLEMQGSPYYFCEAITFPECRHGELSSTVKNLQVSISCTCPDHMILKAGASEGARSEYYCVDRPSCKIDDACGTQVFGGRTKQSCDCPTDNVCAFPESTKMITLGKCVPEEFMYSSSAIARQAFPQMFTIPDDR